MANQPGEAVLTIFDEIIERIKSSRPVGSDNKPIERGFVYSQLVLGQMVDPDDYARPWSPAGGASVADAVKEGQVPANAGAGVPTDTPPPAGATAAPPPSGDAAAAAAAAKMRRAMKAAYNTSVLVDRQLMVTKDEIMRQYPGNGRRISFAWEGIVNGMQPLPAPPMSPEVQKRLAQARKLLFDLEDGEDLGPDSKLYKRYKKNARAYGEAKAAFARAQAEAMSDPRKAEIWPMEAQSYQTNVDEAYDTLKAEGAEKVEAALGVIESIGLSVQDRMIGKARKMFDVWNLNLAGVPTRTPYSWVMPSSWADPEDDDDGWATLKVTSSDYAHHTARHAHFFQQGSSHGDSSSTSGGGSLSIFGFGGSGGGGSSSTHNSSQGSSEATSEVKFANDAENLTIELQYGLCDIYREWLPGDLFYLKNWYLVNNPKNAISDGTFEHQADSTDTLLPMIPTQFLVIRNVRISSNHWKTDGAILEKYVGSGRSDSSTSDSNFNVGAHFGFGPIAFSASVNHSSSDADSSQSSSSDSSGRSDYEASFDGTTLEIKGAQIVAWLSSIVPACPPMDDPGLQKGDAAQPGKAATPQPAPAPAPVA
jgi:uncharacterized membrane protein YgcG